MKMKQDFEARDWKFKEIQVSPSPFKVWGRVNMLRGKKQVLARQLQVFLVRPYPSLYPQPSYLQSYPHTSSPTLTHVLCIWSLSGFPIIHHPCILIPIGTSTPFYLILFPTYLHSWNSLTSGTQSQQQNPQILHLFSEYDSLKLVLYQKAAPLLRHSVTEMKEVSSLLLFVAFRLFSLPLSRKHKQTNKTNRKT